MNSRNHPVSSVFAAIVSAIALLTVGLSAAGPAQASDGTGVIQGAVVGADTGAGLNPGARVEATLEPVGAVTETSIVHAVPADGAFRFDALADGEYTLRFADTAGHYGFTYFGGGSAAGAAVPITVTGGSATGLAPFTLPLGATISGTLKAPAGSALEPGTLIQIVCYCTTGLGVEPSAWVSNESPSYSFSGLAATGPDGGYHFDIEPSYGSIYRAAPWPFAADLRAEAGATLTTDIDLSYVDQGGISGTFSRLPADLAAAVHPHVVATSVPDGNQYENYVDVTDGGGFTLAVPDGTYTLAIMDGDVNYGDWRSDPRSVEPGQAVVAGGAISRIGTWVANPRKPSQLAPVTSVPGDGYAALTWNTPADDGGYPVLDYVVEYSAAGSGGTWTTYPDGYSAATAANVLGLTNGIGYRFRVSAVTAFSSSNPSAVSSLVTPISSLPKPPADPTPIAPAPRPAAPRPQSLAKPVKKKLRAGASAKLAKRTAQGQKIRWTVLTPGACTISKGKVIAKRGSGKCRLVATAAATSALNPLNLTIKIKLRA